MHDRLRIFLLKVATKVILTKTTISMILEEVEQNCCICGFKEESFIHIFKDCHDNSVMAFASK